MIAPGGPRDFPWGLLLSHFSRVDSVRPHRRQPTRLFRPWDSPGKTVTVTERKVHVRIRFSCLKRNSSNNSGFTRVGCCSFSWHVSEAWRKAVQAGYGEFTECLVPQTLFLFLLPHLHRVSLSFVVRRQLDSRDPLPF